LRKYVFSNRVIDHWNALSDACVTSNTINQFKNCFETGIATGNTQLILVIRIVSLIWLLPVLT